MRRIIVALVVAAMLSAAGSALSAQNAKSAAKHEFGADISFAYQKPSGGDGVFTIGTPVDLRVGFIAGDKLVVEPRLSFLFASGSGATAFAFTPLDLNLLWALGESNQQGPYFTVGGGMNYAHFSSGGNSASTSQFSVNGGIGTRAPAGSAAVRLEAFVRYLFEHASDGLPKQVQFGARIGMSLWN